MRMPSVSPVLRGALLVLFLVCLFTYLVFFALSPDPAVQVCGKNCTPDRIDRIRTNLGLTEPFATQFARFLQGLVVGRDYGSGPSSVITWCSERDGTYSMTIHGRPSS